MIPKPALPFGVPEPKIILPLAPGLLLAATPFVSLLICPNSLRSLVVPLPQRITGTPLLIDVPRLLVDALLIDAPAFPLASLVSELLFLGSSLHFQGPALFIFLASLIFPATLSVLILPFV
jgi:hypothetical protein